MENFFHVSIAFRGGVERVGYSPNLPPWVFIPGYANKQKKISVAFYKLAFFFPEKAKLFVKVK